MPRHSKHGPCTSRIFRIIVSINKVVVVCVVVRLRCSTCLRQRGRGCVQCCSASPVSWHVTCESRLSFVSVSPATVRAGDCVASARRAAAGLPPERKIYLPLIVLERTSRARGVVVGRGTGSSWERAAWDVDRGCVASGCVRFVVIDCARAPLSALSPVPVCCECDVCVRSPVTPVVHRRSTVKKKNVVVR